MEGKGTSLWLSEEIHKANPLLMQSIQSLEAEFYNFLNQFVAFYSNH